MVFSVFAFCVQDGEGSAIPCPSDVGCKMSLCASANEVCLAVGHLDVDASRTGRGPRDHFHSTTNEKLYPNPNLSPKITNLVKCIDQRN